MTAGVGIAALLGNFGNWALSYAADKEPIKIGVLHSLERHDGDQRSVAARRRVDGGR